jgi:hypothetical protein
VQAASVKIRLTIVCPPKDRARSADIASLRQFATTLAVSIERRRRGLPVDRMDAATCASPNPRLQAFLADHGFALVEDPEHGLIFVRTTAFERRGQDNAAQL